MAAGAGVLAEDQVEALGDTLDLHLAGALEAAGDVLHLLADDLDLGKIHLAEAALVGGVGDHDLLGLVAHDLAGDGLAGHQILGADDQIHLLGLAEDGAQALLAIGTVDDLQAGLQVQAPVHDALNQALLVEVLLLGVDQQALQVLHAQGDLGLVVGLHDGDGNDGVAVTDQLPGVDLVEHHAVLDIHAAAGILLLLQVDDGDALVAQPLIAALGDGQLGVGTGGGGLGDDRLAAHGLDGLVDGQADLPAGDAAGQALGGAGHQVGLDDDLVAGLDDILQAAQIGDDLIDDGLDRGIVLTMGLANGNSRHCAFSLLDHDYFGCIAVVGKNRIGFRIGLE